MGMRTILNPLRFAREIDRPACIGKGRVRGVKALGVRYENSLAKAMPFAKQGQWFGFGDSLGEGFCQVDLLFEDSEGIVWVVEVKHSWVPEAEIKLGGLYCPIVAMATGKEVRPLVVCKLLRPGARNIHGTLERALRAGRLGAITPVWQWFGGLAVPNPKSERSRSHGQAQCIGA